jgi:hypothetical protein
MPYALVPKDYTLKKVTTAQKAAVDAKRSHDNMMALIDNPEIIKQLIISGLALLAVKEGKEALEDLKDLGVNISKDVESAYTKKRTLPGAPVGVSVQQVLDQALARVGL